MLCVFCAGNARPYSPLQRVQGDKGAVRQVIPSKVSGITCAVSKRCASARDFFMNIDLKRVRINCARLGSTDHFKDQGHLIGMAAHSPS